MVLQGPNEIAAARQVQPVAEGGAGGASVQVPQKAPQEPAERAPKSAPAQISVLDAQVEQVAQKLQRTAELFNKRLDFIVDKSTGRSMVRVLDADTDELIRELPPEKVIELAAKIQEELGVIFDELA